MVMVDETGAAKSAEHAPISRKDDPQSGCRFGSRIGTARISLPKKSVTFSFTRTNC